MNDTRSKSNEQLFNWLGEISIGVGLLGGIVQNDGPTPSKKEIKEFNLRYEETVEQLEAWHTETLRKFNKIKN